jgi:hypothetical protein
MKTVRIERQDHGDEGTFGVLTVDDLKLFTGELPWRDNKEGISCIPAGFYICVFTMSQKFGRKLYLVEGMHRREGIRIHPANLMGDRAKGFKAEMNGCIALGKNLGILHQQKAVLLSVAAMDEFENYMKGESFNLEIVD